MRLSPHKSENFHLGLEKYLKHYEIAIFIIVALSIIFNFLTGFALGFKALILFGVAGLTAIESEYLFYYHTKNFSREKTKPLIKESKTYLDGILIALLLPIGTPIYVIILSVLFANYIVKNSFGGYSYNLFSVCISGYIFATISWSLTAIFNNTFTNVVLEKIFGLPEMGVYELGSSVGLANINTSRILFGNPQLYLGYVPIIFIFCIMGYLIYTKTIDYIIPLTIFILMYTLYSLIDIFYAVDNFPINNITIGYIVFATAFLASDRTIIPKTKNGRIMYSIIIVFITIIIRELTDNVDGVLYAIMFASMFVPMINAKSGMYKLKTRLIIWLTTALFICGFTVFVTTQITHDLDMTKNQVEYYKGGIYE